MNGHFIILKVSLVRIRNCGVFFFPEDLKKIILNGTSPDGMPALQHLI